MSQSFRKTLSCGKIVTYERQLLTRRWHLVSNVPLECRLNMPIHKLSYYWAQMFFISSFFILKCCWKDSVDYVPMILNLCKFDQNIYLVFKDFAISCSSYIWSWPVSRHWEGNLNLISKVVNLIQLDARMFD